MARALAVGERCMYRHVRNLATFLDRLYQEPIVPGDPPTPTPAPRGDSLTCEFCDCTLARNGQVLRVGARAKKLRDAEDEIADRDSTIREKDATIAQHVQRIAELEAQLPKPKAKGDSW